MFRKKSKHQPIIAMFTPGVTYLVSYRKGTEICEKKVEQLSPTGKYIKFEGYISWSVVDDYDILDVLTQ